MGVEPFLIASTMIAAMAQRLVRKVCNNCGETYEPPQDALEELGVSADEISRAKFRKGTGCEACRKTGYKGRIAICEVLPFTPEIKELTVKRATSSDIKQKGRELGMRTLRTAGWARVMTGNCRCS